MLLNGHFGEAFEVFLARKERSHMGVDVSDRQSHGLGAVYLGADLAFHLIRIALEYRRSRAAPETALRVGKARDLTLSGHRTPAIRTPLGVHGDVQSTVDMGMGLKKGSDFRNPGTGHHHRPGGGYPVGYRFGCSQIRGVRHAHVIHV